MPHFTHLAHWELYFLEWMHESHITSRAASEGSMQGNTSAAAYTLTYMGDDDTSTVLKVQAQRCCCGKVVVLRRGVGGSRRQSSAERMPSSQGTPCSAPAATASPRYNSRLPKTTRVAHPSLCLAFQGTPYSAQAVIASPRHSLSIAEEHPVHPRIIASCPFIMRRPLLAGCWESVSVMQIPHLQW